MRHVGLPVLSERQAALENCGYCPKLCRAACPISNAEPRDTITPWGKMSLAWLMARGDLPADPEYARVAWACSGCFACRERCDHRNPVVETLTQVRGDLHDAGVAPSEARRSAERYGERLVRVQDALGKLALYTGVNPGAESALLIGCGYVLYSPDQAGDIVNAARALAGPLRLVQGCCGAPLGWAGDREGARRARGALARDAAGAKTLIVADPGCALALADLSPMLLVTLAARQLRRLAPLRELADPNLKKPVRWHDPCQMGRGLGRYEDPRAVLTRLIGRAPEEFNERREHSACSGAGSLVPLVFPEISRAIADKRVSEHEALGGGTIVTGCGASLLRFRSRKANVVDIGTLLARSLS